MRVSLLFVAATAVTLSAVPAAGASPPAPCRGVPQIVDAKGDGHHRNTDVTAAWFAEAAGRLQAVIQVDQALWEPAHDDSDAAGFVLLFRVGGTVRYVRAEATRGPTRYDHGIWTRAGGFAPLGATTGTTTTGTGGSVTIDVPAETGAVAGATLSGPFVLTYDGGSGADLHWVDRAPGGTGPDTTETGADYVVGSCVATGLPLPPTPDVQRGPGVVTTGLELQVRRRIVGGGTVAVSGRVLPGRSGLPVAVTARGTGKGTAARRSSVRRTVTRADGGWTVRVPLTQSSTVRAVVDGVGSRTATVTVRSTVRITGVQRLSGGRVVVRGRIAPRLPGRVLLLRTDAVRATKTVTPRNGRFVVRLDSPRSGRYQAIFIPSGERAERSTSNTRKIR